MWAALYEIHLHITTALLFATMGLNLSMNYKARSLVSCAASIMAATHIHTILVEDLCLKSEISLR